MDETRVLATFETRRAAEAAATEVNRRLPGAGARLGDVDDELDALALGQRAEVDESIPMIGGGLFSGPFARGALVWGLVGIAVGAVVGALIGVVVDASGWGRWVLVVTLAFAGALAVSSVTFLLGAGAQAVKEGETAANDPTAVVRADGPAALAAGDDVVRLLLDAGAHRARVLHHPVPRPPASDVERPRRPTQDPERPSEQQAQSDAGFRAEGS